MMMNMEKVALKAKKREETGKKMRSVSDKNIPGIVYGKKSEPQKLWIDAVVFDRVFSQAGTNTVVSLTIDDLKKTLDVLIYDYQTDPVTGEFVHVDLYLVDMKKEVEAEVPLVFAGVSPAVKELGGTLVKNSDVIEVRALPGDLPHNIEVDLTKLKTFEDVITVEDITVGDKVEIVFDEDAVIASVSAPRSEEEIAALDDEVDADVSKIEGVADKEGVEEGDEKGESKE
jgi:large subunit ribosomal protein L25